MKVAVIGAGWLGYPLCKALKTQGLEVATSKRSPEQVQKLVSEGLNAVAFQLGDSLPEALKQCDAYVVNIGAGRRKFERDNFTRKMLSLFQQCLDHPARRLLFISTTSVYGEADQVFTEDTPADPISDSARAHVDLERYLQETFAEQCSILRLAGLIGEDRHPVYYLEGKKDVTAAHKKVNLVHRDDVISAISALLQKQLWGDTFHLCAIEHPSRLAYYSAAADALELVPPHFLDDTEQPASGKYVDPTATLEKLGIELKYPSPFDMLPRHDL